MLAYCRKSIDKQCNSSAIQAFNVVDCRFQCAYPFVGLKHLACVPEQFIFQHKRAKYAIEMINTGGVEHKYTLFMCIYTGRDMYVLFSVMICLRP